MIVERELKILIDLENIVEVMGLGYYQGIPLIDPNLKACSTQ